MNEVGRSIRQLAGDERAPREPEERGPDHAARARYSGDHVARAAIETRNDLRAALRATAGDDLLTWRIAPASAAGGQQYEAQRSAEESEQVKTPFQRIISHSGNTKMATVCHRIAMRNTALTSIAAAAR